MNQNAAYIIPRYPILNPQKAKIFENLNLQDSVLLRSTLYLNLIENFIKKESKIDFYFFLDIVDRNFLTAEFNIEKISLSFVDLSNKQALVENLANKEFSKHKKNIFISPDIMGLNLKEVERLLNLLNIEDDSLLIGKSKEGELGFLGFNSYSDEIAQGLIKSDFNYDNFLSKIKSSSHFINTVNDILVVRNLNNFKQLYTDLSQKKSIDYCSQEIHERFTHLFIEHKDLLK
jgi:hypothetical protein